jgi:histidine triad (HIT) family protein
MNECIFCSIVAGIIPHYTVYHDKHVLAFLDIEPRAKGHTVVIPRVHAENVFDLDPGSFGVFAQSLRKSVDRVQEVIQPDGYNIGWNEGSAGGQVVSHLHVHIIPRWKGDGGSSMHGIVNNPSKIPVEELAALFE